MTIPAFRLLPDGDSPRFSEVDLPSLGPQDVLVEVAACGLNFADLLMIEGRYQDTPERPFTMGMEISGLVRAVGSAVRDLAIGTRIAAFPGQGGLAKQAVVPRDRVVALPDQIGLTAAAGVLVTYGTSELAYAQANLTPQDRVLVLGATSGVGVTAVEIAKAHGAHVTAVARGTEMCVFARNLGADKVVDAKDPNFADTLRSQPRYTIVYDPVGGAQYAAALRAVAPLARYLLIGFASGDVPQLPANILMVKNVTVVGLYWGGYFKFAPHLLTASLDRVMGLIAEGGLSPAPAQVLPFHKAAEALDMLRSRAVRGKIVVEVQTLE